MKISIIGAGNVGATAAMRIAERNIADLVLLDIAAGAAKGKALDIRHASALTGLNKNITGTDDYSDIKGSNIVVVSAGFARQPGMSREDLLIRNAQVVKGVTENIKKHAPSSIIIMVTNPLDAMTYLACKVSGFREGRVMGMAGALDSARFARILADELKVKVARVKTTVIGPHSDSMIPLLDYTKVNGRPVKKILSAQRLDELVAAARNCGSAVVELLGRGSAYFAPSAAISEMAEAILKNRSKVLPASCYLKGEYGLSGLCIGVPAKIGKNGVEDIVELKLTAGEKASLNNAADNLKRDIGLLNI